jgi:hypothetical protein
MKYVAAFSSQCGVTLRLIEGYARSFAKFVVFAVARWYRASGLPK